MTKPARLAFWRMLLGSVSVAAFLSFWQTWTLAGKLGITPQASKSWLVVLGIMGLVGVTGLFLLVFSWSGQREKLLDGLEAASKLRGGFRWAALPILCLAVLGYSAFVFHGYYTDLIRTQDWIRLFIFMLLALLGMVALKMFWQSLAWPAALLVVILFQAAVYRLALYLPEVSAYPFAMGWSETSRFYWPSLFVAQKIYGQSFPWPILHPSLHLLLVPPYLFDAPLWVHRLWQVLVRLALVGLIAPALLARLKVQKGWLYWLTGLWIVVYLFTLPLYLHLAVPVLIMLWGFSAMDERRTWIALIAASIWAGLSRLNWYPMPGILAAILFVLEVRQQGKKGWRYLLKPAAWFISGTAIAFGAQRLYIAFSGIRNPGDFYTSLTSSLLWQRLWPNPSYWLGILPGIVIFSCALWWLIGLSLWKGRSDWSRLRVASIALALLVLFAGGIVVSMKIGGGADLHNMDAYAVLLLVVGLYLVFGAYAPERDGSATAVMAPWGAVALLVLIPAFFILQIKSSIWKYDPAEAQLTLQGLQQEVDMVNGNGGQILFITQRHLIAMHMLNGVKLVPEYEREELMEMAMAGNETYLQTFRSDLAAHRFAAIVVDPLTINFVGDGEAMGAENDAWTRYVAKRILCTYRQEAIFPDDHIAIYVPQEGAGQCP